MNQILLQMVDQLHLELVVQVEMEMEMEVEVEVEVELDKEVILQVVVLHQWVKYQQMMMIVH